MASTSDSQTSLPLLQQYQWRSVLKLHSRSTLITATETVTQLETRSKKVVLLIDSLYVLQSLTSGNPEDNILHNLVQSINNLKSRTTYVLQWIPAHTGIHGNEVAISWRKREARSSSPNPTLVTEKQKRSSETRGQLTSSTEMEVLIPNKTHFIILSRHEQSMIFRLITGLCRLCRNIKIDWHRRVSPLTLRTGSTNYNPCPAAMPSPQRRKAKHLANRKIPRKQTSWNSN